MDKGFLYRRLAKFVPCVLPGIGKKGLSLRSKYDVASARDVFLSAHYWRLFEFLQAEPHLVVDLGAHCGHFSVLCHLVIEEKFGSDTAEYIMVEPVELLLELAKENLTEAGIIDRSTLCRGLIGKKVGGAHLNTNRHNLLASSVSTQSIAPGNAQSDIIPFLDLNLLLPSEQTIDVLKIDIEGCEREFSTEYPEVLSRTKVLMVELHEEVELQQRWHERITALGMKQLSTPIRRGSESMRVYAGAQV